jgi:regulator of sigma E protease
LIGIVHVVLALLGLSFLVFIHELGHYLVARRKGMRVEAFAIGFGKPLLSWEHNGVKWRICLLPFGGYVKIAGMQKEGELEPSQIPDGFFGKGPWARIQVALAGPIVNILFALAAFSAIWWMGVRTRPFFELTQYIGWVDPHSELYANGVRPGDFVERYDNRPFHGVKDLAMTSLMKQETVQISGVKQSDHTPFDYTLKPYPNPDFAGKDKISTIGVLAPARYLMYPGEGALPGSVVEGLQKGDRIVWLNGESLFSLQQMSMLLNEPMVLLTVQRERQIVQVKVPRVALSDLRLPESVRDEIGDWRHEAGLGEEMQYIPYNLSSSLYVEGDLRTVEEVAAPEKLLPQDQILAVGGVPVHNTKDFLLEMQKRHASLIVQRSPSFLKTAPMAAASSELEGLSQDDLQGLVDAIGLDGKSKTRGALTLLAPVEPKTLSEFPLSDAQKAQLAKDLAQSKKQIEAIADLQLRADAMDRLEKGQQRVLLGLTLVDREVQYNPGPFTQFTDVVKDVYRTLSSLFTGSASPKYITGPVGIIQVVQSSFSMGPKEVLFWLAFISLNLGLVNLLPLPVLDGGHIVLSFVEMAMRKPLSPKAMERLIVPFVVLLIGFFLFVTYNDIARLFSRFL